MSAAQEIAPLVVTDIAKRVEHGIGEYGRPLSTTSVNRDALWDAYEEALDLVLYLRQEIERRTLNKLWRETCEVIPDPTLERH